MTIVDDLFVGDCIMYKGVKYQAIRLLFDSPPFVEFVDSERNIITLPSDTEVEIITTLTRINT